jgi:hypothetical protein
MPASSEAITVRAARTRPTCGRSSPTAANSALRPSASATPTPTPAAEASPPTASASSSTPRRTCPRVAPTIRSSPNSRVRWATVIESELKMVNPPTSTAIPANASRIARMIVMNDFSESNVKRSSAAAERISAPGPTARASVPRATCPPTRMRS